MKKVLSAELAGEIKSWFETQAVKDVIAATKSQEGDTGSFEVIITTENVDRYGEVIKLDGWDLSHYMNNPVVLWGHDHHTPPVGVCTAINVVDGKMVATGKFAPNEFAQELRNLYDMGMLRATSVGFIVKEQEGNLITKAELIEFSFVSVPANPYALALALEKELAINELVTKGFLNIKEAEPVEEKKPEEVKPVEEVVTPPAEEKKFSVKAVTPLVEQLKGVITALEALGAEPERDEDEEQVVTEDEKALETFKQKKTVQEAATILGEVLAEWRLKDKK